jgi:CheY-like chemotaxis protein/anti-sigma regulatory factor (Ser/Thr protein kinase)
MRDDPRVQELTAELALAREELERERRRSESFASMSHEMRTLLAGVVGIADVLLDTELSAEQRDCARRVRSSGHALLDIINDVLDFTKIEQDTITVDPGDLDVRRVVEDVGELLAERAHSRGIELFTQIAPSVPAVVRGDAARVRQVLLNLTGNAIKFTDRGEVVVRASTLRESGDDVWLRFEVEDTGVGIEAASLARIFEPFAQAAPDAQARGGSGLGLAIAKRLVDAMGGEMSVTSELGSGSTFSCELHLERRPAPVERSIPRTDLHGRRALVVTGNPRGRALVVELLAAMGLEAQGASDGASTIAALEVPARRRRVDLVLIDAELPDMDGASLARAVERTSFGTSTRVVMMGYPGAHRPTAATANVVDYLAKPVRRAHLASCVEKALGGLEETIQGALALTPHPSRIEVGPRADTDSHTTRPRVLVVEDDTVNQKVAAFLMQKRGYAADVVGTGREAVEAVLRSPYAAIFMDCHLPRFDGFQAAQEIRAREAPERRTPIIATTADTRPAVRERCIAAGMDDYLTKPLVGPELDAALRRWCGEPPPREATEARRAPLVRERRPTEPPAHERAAPRGRQTTDAAVRDLITRPRPSRDAVRAAVTDELAAPAGRDPRSEDHAAHGSAPKRDRSSIRHSGSCDDAAEGAAPRAGRAPFDSPVSAPSHPASMRQTSSFRNPPAREEPSEPVRQPTPMRHPLAREEPGTPPPLAPRPSPPDRRPVAPREITPDSHPPTRDDDPRAPEDRSSRRPRSVAPAEQPSTRGAPTPARPELARSSTPPEPTRSTTPPSAIDRAVVARLRELEKDGTARLLQELTEIYLEDSATRLGKLRDAAAKGDAVELTRVAHALKGSSAQIGARSVESIAARIETIGPSGTTTDATPLLRLLETELDRVGAAMAEELSAKVRK